ncbi:MAG: ABC transporter permease, partial [Rhodospirillales bacterium]|nr:ABC transporter permease [Rhodospirillales bacterium]
MSSNLQHYVSDAPFDPYSVEQITPEQERYYMAPQWLLIWWKFKKHKLAMFSAFILLTGYLSILITEFLAPYALDSRNTDFIYAPPQGIHMFHEGEFVGPFVYGLKYTLNMETLKREYSDDTTKVQPIRFFCSGDDYNFWGLIPGSFHLMCPAKGGTMFLIGTDRL